MSICDRSSGRAWWRGTIVLLWLLLPSTTSHAQQDEPSGGLTIVSPPDGSYISGPVVLQARMPSGT